jgi:glycosyltransferase involved in cell wall biosynthesis
MVGSDKGNGYFVRFQELVKTLGLADRVILPGRVSKAEVPYWMNKGDIFLNTSNVDNTPVSVLEAMACGLCVISTNVGGNPYLLEHEQDALLVPPDDPAAMIQAVRRLLTEEGLAEQLSGNSRQKAEQFDWSNILPRWEKLLTSVSIGHTV